MLTIQHTDNTHTVGKQWEFYSDLSLIIDIQVRPTVCTPPSRTRIARLLCAYIRPPMSMGGAGLARPELRASSLWDCSVVGRSTMPPSLGWAGAMS